MPAAAKETCLLSWLCHVSDKLFQSALIHRMNTGNVFAQKCKHCWGWAASGHLKGQGLFVATEDKEQKWTWRSLQMKDVILNLATWLSHQEGCQKLGNKIWEVWSSCDLSIWKVISPWRVLSLSCQMGGNTQHNTVAPLAVAFRAEQSLCVH